MKVDVEYLEYMWPMRHFLITCGDINRDQKNIIAVSFCMPVAKEPPLIACAIGKNAYSYKLINETREFVVNIPQKELKSEIYYCGYHSGYQVNKFEETDLNYDKAKSVKAPIVAECVAHMECVLNKKIKTGEKFLFVGEVVEAYAEESLVKGDKTSDYAQGSFPEKVYATRFKNRD